MESANQPSDFSRPFDQQNNPQDDVHKIERDEHSSVMTFVQNALYTHIHADWYNWRYWITNNHCWLNYETIKDNRQLTAAVAITQDVPSVAWLRLMALHRVPFSGGRLRQQTQSLFGAHLETLQQSGTEQILWMSDKEWVRRWADTLGFTPYRELVTFTKDDVDLPANLSINSDVTIRPAVPEDMRQLAKIEADTYEPMWQNTMGTLLRAYDQSVSFQIARHKGELVGFQVSTPNEKNGVHLARISVAPSAQGLGIGRTLLAAALQDYARKRKDHVTLNTQEDNGRAQHLYRRFGFLPTGHSATIWRYDLSRDS